MAISDQKRDKIINVIKEGPKPAADLLNKIANKIHDVNFSTKLTETQRLKELHDLDVVLEVFIFSLPYNGPWDKIFDDAKSIRQGLSNPNKTQHRMRDLADGARLELEVEEEQDVILSKDGGKIIVTNETEDII